MPDITFPADLVDLQRRSHAAWAEVEAHRKGVDAKRRAAVEATVDPTRKWESPALRPWTATEDAEHARLLGLATEAALALRAGVAEAGLDGGYETAQGLHKAARA